MDLGEQILALEVVIKQFATNQFEANGIPLSMRYAVMKNVLGAFSDDYIQSVIKKSVTPSETEKNVQEITDSLNKFYDGGNVDGDTAQTGSVQ